MAEHYKALEKFESVKGEGSVEDIFEALSKTIEAQLAIEQSPA